MDVGSMGNLHAGVMKLDQAYLESGVGKGVVVGNLTAALPVRSKNTLPIHPSSSVRGGVTYTVLDDLTVTRTR